MKKRLDFLFLMLVLAQGLHSIEEYVGRLWEVFPPARILCGMVSNNLETGFLVINIGLFIFGIACWWMLRKGFSGFVWFWILIEIINGIGHPLWALREMTYTPGLATAPILLALAVSLLKLKIKHFET